MTGKFVEGVAVRVTPDIYRVADGSLSYRLKYAFATWTPEKSALTFKFGQMHTPWLDWEEHLWDYRMQGQQAMERAGYMSSSDFGAGVDGNWGFDKVNMQIGVYNGENYNRTPGDKGKDLMGRVSVRVLATDEGGRDGGLRLTGYGQIGRPNGGGTRDRFIGMVVVPLEDAHVGCAAGGHQGHGPRPAPGCDQEGPGHQHLRRAAHSPDVQDPDHRSIRLHRSQYLRQQRSDQPNHRVSYQLSGNLRVLGDIDHLSYQGGVTTPANEAVRSQALFQMQFTF